MANKLAASKSSREINQLSTCNKTESRLLGVGGGGWGWGGGGGGVGVGGNSRGPYHDRLLAINIITCR